MSRLRLSASPIASLSVALLLSLVGNTARIAAAAEAAASRAGSTWQAANESDNPFRASTAAEWSPVRPRQPGTTAPPADDDGQTPSTKNRYRVVQAAATTGPSHSAESTPPAANTRWQLPNGQSTTGNRAPRKPLVTTATREPQPFKPPTNATQLSSPTARTANVAPWSTPSNANVRPIITWPPQTVSTAPRTSATNNPTKMRGPGGARSTNNANNPANRPTTPGRIAADPRATYPPSSRGASSIGRKADSYSGRVWDSISVAFQAPETLLEGGAVEPDNLPLPGGSSMHSRPMMHGGPDMAGPEYDGSYGGCADGSCPHGGPGGCSCPGGCSECRPMCGDGMCGCEPGCGCGCGGEIGCACEPGCGCPNGGGCDINACGQGDPAACTTIRIGVPKWQDFILFGGVQGFKGPYDQDRDSGNFGFHEGFNTGFKMPFTSMGYQVGYQGVHSQLSGDKDTNIADPHTQQFVTAGVFQRVKDGIQWGVVWDMLRDERWGAVDFHQLRGELAFIDHGCHEMGLAAAVHLNDDEQFFFNNQEDIFSINYQATDQYLAFYRFHGRQGGEGRFYGGFNDDSDGIIGADMLLPVSNRWSLQAAFTYLIPDEPGGQFGAQQEAWNLSMALVWHWDCAARRSHNNCYRPLFNVADNGYLIVDDRPGVEPDNNNGG